MVNYDVPGTLHYKKGRRTQMGMHTTIQLPNHTACAKFPRVRRALLMEEAHPRVTTMGKR